MSTEFWVINPNNGDAVAPVRDFLRANWTRGLDRISQANWEFSPSVDVSHLPQGAFVRAIRAGRVEFEGIVETITSDFGHPTFITASSLEWCLTGRMVAWPQELEGRTQFSQTALRAVFHALIDSNLRQNALQVNGRFGDGRWLNPSWAESEVSAVPDTVIDLTVESNTSVWNEILSLCDSHTLRAEVRSKQVGSELQPQLIVRPRPYGTEISKPLLLGHADVVKQYTYTDSLFQHVNRIYVVNREGETDAVTVVQGQTGANALLRETVENSSTGQDTPAVLGHGVLDRAQDERQTGDLALGQNPNFQYGRDFNLGDRIPIQGFGTVPSLSFDLESVTCILQEDGAEQINFEFHREGSYEDA